MVPIAENDVISRPTAHGVCLLLCSNSARCFRTYVDSPAHSLRTSEVGCARRSAYQQGRAQLSGSCAQRCEARRHKWLAQFRTYDDTRPFGREQNRGFCEESFVDVRGGERHPRSREYVRPRSADLVRSRSKTNRKRRATKCAQRAGKSRYGAAYGD